ncbi:MAG: CBS domain-containing protein [Nitrospira sp.]|nr:CBS domain-containing protein [Nitrospira sp.]
MNIKSILATKGANVVTIKPEQTVREALAALARHNVGALVVIDEANSPVGIISERDIVRLAAENEKLFSLPIVEVMTKNLILGVPQDELRAVANTMTERRIRHLPVVNAQGKLIGIISIGDVVKAQRNLFEGEANTLRTQILAGEA